MTTPRAVPGEVALLDCDALYSFGEELAHCLTHGVGVLMAVAEGLEWVLTSRFTKKYGGSRRAGWGAVIGGMVGAFMGVPIPIVGSIVGAFAGAFIGAFVFEWSREQNHGVATRVAWGALIGRVVAAAIKVAIGLTMAAWMVWAVLL